MNALHGIGWNCFVMTYNPRLELTRNLVVFGYAYNNRWMWRSAQNFALVVLWKDYNSVIYTTVSVNVAYQGNSMLRFYGSAELFFSRVENKEMILLPPASNPNIWDNAIRISDAIHANVPGSYTVILAENAQALDGTFGFTPYS